MRGLTLPIKELRDETPAFRTFVFDLPEELKGYQAGQFVMIHLEGQPKSRAYTFSSSPTEKNVFCFTVQREEKSRVVGALFEKKVGDTLSIQGPMGKFTLLSEPAPEAVFITAGPGITPLRSMIKSLKDTGHLGKIHLLYGENPQAGTPFLKEFESWGLRVERHPWAWGSEFPTEAQIDTLLQSMASDIQKTHFYLCGLGDLVPHTLELLKSKNVPAALIRSEKW